MEKLVMPECAEPTHLDLFFPEWQGYGAHNGVLHGAASIRDLLAPSKRFAEVDVVAAEDLEVEHGVLGYRPLVRMTAAAREIVEQARPRSIFLLGGTCGSEIVPVSYLNHVYRGDLAVLWFDAHGDLNTPDSSRSKRFHGMPLRTLLGEGPADLAALCYSTLTPAQVILVGARDLEDSERAYVSSSGMVVLPPSDLRTAAGLVQAVRATGRSNLYLHLDLDVLDPSDFPHLLMPTPGGISFSELLSAIREVRRNIRTVGASVVEYVPIGAGAPEKIKQIVDALGP